MNIFPKAFLCSWLHGGGDIKRDEQGRINWQCRKCGRWSEPVTLKEEAAVVNAALKEKNNEYTTTSTTAG